MSASNQGKGRVRYFEVGLIVAVVAVLALLLRPKPEKKPDAPNLAAVRQDLLTVMTPIWGSQDPDLTLNCSPERVLDVRLALAQGVPPRNFWLTQIVNFVCVNQILAPGESPLRPGQLEAIEVSTAGTSRRANIMAAPPWQPVSDAEMSKRGNDLLDQQLGPQRALFLVETMPPTTSLANPAEDLYKPELADAPSVVAGKRSPEAPSDVSRAPQSNLSGESMMRRRQAAPHGPEGGAPAAVPAPRSVPQAELHAFVVLSAQLDARQDDKVRALLASVTHRRQQPPTPLTVIHLVSHGVVSPSR